MTATTPSTALVPVQPTFAESERLALAGFLAGYPGPPGGTGGPPATARHQIRV